MARRMSHGWRAITRALTSGVREAYVQADGKDIVLWPLTNGVLAYTGFSVLEPLVANAVGFVSDEERA